MLVPGGHGGNGGCACTLRALNEGLIEGDENSAVRPAA
jgi:hypothetical protein